MVEQERSGGKERSPNYPAIGLPKAIECARALWEREKRTAVPPVVAAKAWGYRSLSGPARTTVAALRQYGLVESVGGAIALSDLAVDILIQIEGSEALVTAIQTAANGPDLFRELRQTHASASDEALNAYLITKKRFSVDGAQRCIRSFRETVALANRASEGYAKAETDQTLSVSHDMSTPSMTVASQTIGNNDVTFLTFPLFGGMRAEVRFVGGPLEPKHISGLEKYLKIAREELADSGKAVES